VSQRKKHKETPEKKPRETPEKPRRFQIKFAVIGWVVLVIALAVFLLWPRGPRWAPYQFPDGGFVVEVPGEVSQQKSREGRTKFGPARERIAKSELSSGEAYTLIVADLPMDQLQSTDAKTLLQELTDKLLRQVPNGVLKSNTDELFQGFPGKELQIVSSQLEGMEFIRLTLIGRRWVALIVGGPDIRPGNERALRFFRSFKITDQKLIEQGERDLTVMKQ
jgi:hypothetical protein